MKYAGLFEPTIQVVLEQALGMAGKKLKRNPSYHITV